MSITIADQGNADQIAYWNGPGGRSWVERQESQEASLAPVSTVLIERAAVRPGEHVVDIGCGTGATTMEIAARVGPTGSVLAIDVSEPMLAGARARLRAGLRVTFVQADATTYAFPPAAFDLLVSRFGVMFFADPAKSFANLRTSLRRGGRLVFACWRKPEENPWLTVPLRAVHQHVPRPPQPGPEDPGMFSFAGTDRIARVLGQAGFDAIRTETLDLEVDVARGKGLDEAAASVVMVGPASRALEGQMPEIRRAAVASVRSALVPYAKGATVPLAAAIWIVTATA
jgi:SAM-dependent methyltransferase